MAVAWSYGGLIDVASGLSGTVTLTFAANDLVAAFVRGGTNVSNTISTSDNGGNTWNNGTSVTDTSDSSDTLGDFFAQGCNAGSTVVTCSQTASGHSLRCTVDGYTGCSTSGGHIDGNTTFATATSGTVTTSGTSTAINDLVLAWSSTNALTLTAGSGYTLETQEPVAPNTKVGSEWKAATAGGSQTATMTWGGSSQGYDMHIATYRVAGAAAGLIETHMDPGQQSEVGSAI